MECFAFPCKIEIKEIKIDVCSSKLFFHWKHRETLSFRIANQREVYQSKKLNVKSLSSPYTKSTYQSCTSKMYRLGMLARQTQSAELSIVC